MMERLDKVDLAKSHPTTIGPGEFTHSLKELNATNDDAQKPKQLPSGKPT